MTNKSKKIIYVHPKTSMLNRCMIPISLPALINRIPYEVNGYYASEVNTKVLRSARIMIIDIHWYLSLKGAKQLIKKAKRINPEIVIIAGGITASLFPDQIVKELSVDYVIEGDSEIPMPELIRKLIKQEDIRKVPNIVSKDFHSDHKYVLTREDMEHNQFYQIDFFPSFKKDIIKIHQTHNKWPLAMVFPFLIAVKNSSTTGRKIRLPSEKLAKDLNLLNNSKEYSFINIYHDFITQNSISYCKKVLNKKFELKVVYEFAIIPSLEQADLLTNSFSGGELLIRVSSKDLINSAEIYRTLKHISHSKNYLLRIYFSPSELRNNKEYKQFFNKVVKNIDCYLFDPGKNEQNDFLGNDKDELFYKAFNKVSWNRYLLMNILVKTFSILSIITPNPRITLFLKKLTLKYPYLIMFKISVFLNWDK